MTMSKLPAAEQLQRPGFNFQSHGCKSASLIAPKAILSALDVGLKKLYKKTQGSDSWGVSPPVPEAGTKGEDLHPGEYLHLLCSSYMPAEASSVED